MLIFAFCFLNRRTGGMLIVALGVAINVLAITLNGGMPTKDDVKERNGREVHVPIERTVKHKPQESGDLLPFLGDVITAPGVPNQQFSVGDIVIGIGVVDICFQASRRPRGRGDPSARSGLAGYGVTAGSRPARSSATSSAPSTRASYT